MASSAFAVDVTFSYPTDKSQYEGKNVTPADAYKMASDDAHTFIVDVRTRPEYVLVGHPDIAYLVPIMFWTGKYTSKSYGMNLNQNFYKDLTSKFNKDTDTLIFMCRSGGRSLAAAKAAIKAGWPADKTYNMLGGFEGDKVGNKMSAFHGKRKMGGWKNEGLPWTYSVDPKLAYPEAE